MITAYYKNSRGDILNFLRSPYSTAEADWFDSNWDEDANGYEKTVQIDVHGDEEDFAQNMEHLYSIIAVDAEEGTYGRLYVNDTFLRCRIQSSVKKSWIGYTFAEVELTFIAPELSWVTEVKKEFYKRDPDGAKTGLDFPFDFPFDFAAEDAGSDTWEIDHVTASDFRMIIYGPCSEPRVIINDHSYTVHTDVGSGEYLVIDSRDCTLVKHLENGTTQSMFDERGLADSVFEKIPSGLLRINWSGDFGWGLTLFLERREARW